MTHDDGVAATASPPRQRRDGPDIDKDAEPRTGLVDVNFIKLPLQVPQVLLRQIERIDRFPRRDGLELDGLGHACG